QRPITYFEIVRDGKVVERVDVKGGRKKVDVSRKLLFKRSGWLAIRAGHVKPAALNWGRTLTAAHSSPIYVTVNDRLPADKDSAKYMIARMDTTIEWADSTATWSSDKYKARALTSYRKARAFYEQALDRAAADGQ
ncbi:hypothetical protein LCGC14_2327490, partial [marine sediment metagenome]